MIFFSIIETKQNKKIMIFDFYTIQYIYLHILKDEPNILLITLKCNLTYK